MLKLMCEVLTFLSFSVEIVSAWSHVPHAELRKSFANRCLALLLDSYEVIQVHVHLFYYESQFWSCVADFSSRTQTFW